MLDPARSNYPILNELESAANRVIRSGQYILGSEVESFEKACASYLKVKETIAVSSGTDALLLSLMVHNIGPGDEVICPSFTFFATAGVISRTGAKPVFVDILPQCFTCDPEAVRRAITPLTRAIIPVHLFGQSADMNEITKIAKENNIIVIEDACQSIGSSLDSKMIGSIGDMGCFSFFPSKNLGGFGDAGLITTNDQEIAKELRILRVHGGKEQYKHEQIGGNFRIDAIQAALLKVKLPYLDILESKRNENAQFYINSLKDIGLYKLPQVIRGKHVWNQFTLRIMNNKRTKLKKYLKTKNISTGVYYPIPLHQQKCFKDNSYLPCSESTSLECLSIPIASEITSEQIKYVSHVLIQFSKGNI